MTGRAAAPGGRGQWPVWAVHNGGFICEAGEDAAQPHGGSEPISLKNSLIVAFYVKLSL